MKLLMTSKVKLQIMKICVFILNFHQNRFLNKCARKKKAKYTEFRTYRRNYVRTDFFVSY